MQIKKRVLIVGAGDVAQRAIPWLRKRFRVYALVRQQSAFASLRAQGVTPLLGDLDQALTLKRISSLAQWILHFAPE